MKFLVFTRTPGWNNGLFKHPETITVDVAEAEGDMALEKIKDRCHVPLNGNVWIVPEDETTKLKSRIINEVVEN